MSTIMPDNRRIVRDQNGVVWTFGDGTTGMMSPEAYEYMRPNLAGDAPAYEDLPLWDSHDQNIVDVD